MSQLLIAIVLVGSLLKPAAALVSREDLFVNSDAGIRIHIREIRNTDVRRGCDPILLVHGARAPGVASFDLPVPGGSLAADLWQAIPRGTHARHRVFDPRTVRLRIAST